MSNDAENSALPLKAFQILRGGIQSNKDKRSATIQGLKRPESSQSRDPSEDWHKMEGRRGCPGGRGKVAAQEAGGSGFTRQSGAGILSGATRKSQ